jgi:chromosome segregation ATPase
MTIPENDEKTLLADIDALRSRFPQTLDLYREVCAIMFFRYGMTPTANKLYQLVRKGSMSAPAEALNRFWENLREKSRVTIDHPDLPDTLKAATGALVATLWQTAQETAHEGLASFKNEALVKTSTAEDALVKSTSEISVVRTDIAALRIELRQAHDQIECLSHESTSLNSTNASLEGQLNSTRADLAGSLERLDASRRDFAAELDKIRSSAKQNEERLSATEARALVEIDRERMASTQARKVSEAALSAKNAADVRHRQETLSLQKQLATYSHQNGMQAGELRAMATTLEKLQIELERLHGQLRAADADVSALRAKNEIHEKQKSGSDTTEEPRAAVGQQRTRKRTKTTTQSI